MRDVDKLYRANERDFPKFHGVMKAYSNALNIKAYGRFKGCRPPDKWIPIIAVPEFQDRQSAKTHPHWHCMIKLPHKIENELIKFSYDFWFEQGRRYCGMPVKPDFQAIYDHKGASNYALKWLDEENTLEYTIIRGI
jgi:hypothetical protein